MTNIIETDSRETPNLEALKEFEKLAENPDTFVGDHYLRHRPFLVVTSIARPAKGVRTEEAGWAKEPRNWSMFERPAVVDRISNRMLEEASVIIDLVNRKIVKNRFCNETEDAKVLAYYLGKYQAEATQGVQIWTEQLMQAVKANA